MRRSLKQKGELNHHETNEAAPPVSSKIRFGLASNSCTSFVEAMQGVSSPKDPINVPNTPLPCITVSSRVIATSLGAEPRKSVPASTACWQRLWSRRHPTRLLWSRHRPTTQFEWRGHATLSLSILAAMPFLHIMDRLTALQSRSCSRRQELHSAVE